jgi:hypothetical protein
MIFTFSSLKGNIPEKGMRQGRDCLGSVSGAFPAAGDFSSDFFFETSFEAFAGVSVSCLFLRGRSLWKRAKSLLFE